MQAPCWNVWKQSQLNFRATVPTGCTSSSLALWLSLRKWAAMLETRRLSTRSEIFYFGKIFHRLILRLNKASTLVSWHLWTMPPGCQLCFFLLLSKPDPGLQLLLPKTTWEWHVSSISFVFIFLIPSLDFVLVVYLEICFRNMPIFYKNKFDNLTEINIDKKKFSQQFLMRCLCSPRHNGIWTPAGSMHGHYEEEHGGVRGATGQSVRLKGSFVSLSKEIINQSSLNKKHFIPGKDIQLLSGAWTEKRWLLWGDSANSRRH